MDGIRLVVTGHDPDGKGVVVKDELVGPHPRRAAGYQSFLMWGADEPLHFPDDGLQATFEEPAPAVGGLRLSILLVKPDAEFEAELAEVGNDQPLPGVLESADGLHLTSTVDLGIVLEGEVWLELDNGREVHLGAGDCFVQNGTPHAWRNHGDTTARVGVAVIGVEHDRVQ